eukprot:GEMP01125555.1.p1 GENE.GEMP01125555.1~~GEMP01125555.1.p1  ORF type:complete len:111 (-),score=16.45 GEMP01125555.1:54-386(-)
MYIGDEKKKPDFWSNSAAYHLFGFLTLQHAPEFLMRPVRKLRHAERPRMFLCVLLLDVFQVLRKDAFAQLLLISTHVVASEIRREILEHRFKIFDRRSCRQERRQADHLD